MNYSVQFKQLVFLFICIISLNQTAAAQDYRSAIGGRLGSYISGSFTTFTSEDRSVEIIAGITREANTSQFLFGSFYRFHFDVTSQLPTLKWYAGLGLYINSLEKEASSSELTFLPSAIIGMEYTLEHTPVNFFLDLSPYYNTDSATDSNFDVHANLGVRYILKWE
ncbi:MAG: hypothetical protein AAGA77_15585 [Bacteroidota bacterium]